jgi:hypothetical protein
VLEGTGGTLKLGGGGLEVDPQWLGQAQRQLVAPSQRLGTNGGAHPRQQRAQRGLLGHGGVLRPQRPDQLLAPGQPVAVQQQVQQQQPDLAPAQPVGHLGAVDLYG